MTLVTATIVAFVLMIGMMLIGIPIAVSMLLVGVVGGTIAYGMPFLNSMATVIWGVGNEYLLTAIPMFVLLGELLLRSGIADRMYLALSAWLSGLPGGLLHTNIGCCALFAATSGSSVATAATVGTVALPQRMRLLVHLLPPAVVFAVVMGSIYTGLATATESAALGVVVALTSVTVGLPSPSAGLSHCQVLPSALPWRSWRGIPRSVHRCGG